MEYLKAKLAKAQAEEDFSSMIDIMQQISNVRVVINSRQAIKNLTVLSNDGKEEKKPYLWLTVNPASECSLEDFKRLVQKCFSKKWIKSYVYVYEQRGTSMEDIGRGYHIHAIISKPEHKPQTHCIREIANTFSKCCDVTNYHCFNTKWIGQEEYVRKLGYILGDKESTPENNKQLKQEMDKIWREMRQIDKKYNVNIDIGQYAP